MNISKILLLSLVISLPLLSRAQDEKQGRERIEAYRVQFITAELDLSPAEAQQFWPLYNQYRKEQQKLRRNKDKRLMRQRLRNIDGLSDKELEEALEAELEMQQQQVDLRRKYYEQYKKVLPIQKVARLYRAEIEFQKKLMRRLGEKHHPNR